MTNNKLPEVDLPIEFMAAIDITEDILGLYKFPCRIQAGIFVLCLEGEMKASINLTEYHIKKNDMISLAPGTIIQFHTMTKNLRIYFIGFSSKFMDSTSLIMANMDFSPFILEKPVLPLKEEMADIFKDYFALLNKAFSRNRLREKEIPHCILISMLSSLATIYFETAQSNRMMSRSEAIYKQLTKLIMKHFSSERKVAFYAKLLNITPQHLSVIVKQTSGKTVSDVIAEIVIMDAKAKLKSTNMTIQEISDSLNFPNMSFFGKYFKRYVKMSPNEYRKIE